MYVYVCMYVSQGHNNWQSKTLFIWSKYAEKVGVHWIKFNVSEQRPFVENWNREVILVK